MYFFFKSLHLIAMVTWFAGLFYMFRLFVYHVENKDKKDAVDVFKVMEHKLFFYITTPGMAATWLFGSMLLMSASYNMTQNWFAWKFFMLICLTSYHVYIGYTLKRFKKDDIFLTSKQCRILNEVPTIFLIGIICVAVYRSAIG